MLFSILIANYNNGHFFKECYTSIITQTYNDWEVIIVDDGSTDDSVKQINTIIGNDSRFHLYQNDKNYGCGYTKEKCIELANGEICGFLDPDDALVSSAIEIMIDVHIENPWLSLVYSNLFYCKDKFSNKIAIKNDVIPSNLNYLTGMYKYKIGHFATFKKSLYENSEGINSILRRAVDQDLYLKCEEQGAIMHIDNYLYLYRIHSGGISTLDNNINAISWHIYVIMEACKRRDIDFEDILSGTLYTIFYQNDKYKLGSWLLDNIFGRTLNKILQKLRFIK